MNPLRTYPALNIAAAGVALYFLREARAVLVPFVVAVLLYLLAEPIVRGLAAWKVPRGAAIALVLLGLCGIFGLAAMGARRGLTVLYEDAPRYEERLRDLKERLARRIGAGPEGVGRLPILKRGGEALEAVAEAALGGLALGALQLVLVVAYLALLLRAAPGAKRRWGELFPGSSERILSGIEDTQRQIARFLALQSAISLANGVVVWAILAAYGVEPALLWGMLNFVSQFVPTVGPIAASLPPVAVALVQFDSPAVAAWVAVWLFASQMASGYFIEPRVLGRGMRLDPIAVLLGLAFFGWLWGILGAFLSVPILAAAKIASEQAPSLRRLGTLLRDPVAD